MVKSTPFPLALRQSSIFLSAFIVCRFAILYLIDGVNILKTAEGENSRLLNSIYSNNTGELLAFIGLALILLLVIYLSTAAALKYALPPEVFIQTPARNWVMWGMATALINMVITAVIGIEFLQLLIQLAAFWLTYRLFLLRSR